MLDLTSWDASVVLKDTTVHFFGEKEVRAVLRAETSIMMDGSAGIDAGGLTRQWRTLLGGVTNSPIFRPVQGVLEEKTLVFDIRGMCENKVLSLDMLISIFSQF